MTDGRAPWILVLAGGAGTRLSSLTRATDGVAVPKQYCTLQGGPSLLADAIERALLLTAPERVVIVVAAEHERWWRPQLADVDPANVIVQPQNRGTAPGILLPLRLVLARDPRARVLVTPSDHWFAAPGTAIDALHSAQFAAMATPANPVLLGAVADGPDPEYGWIVPAAAAVFGEVRPVAQFVEKPLAARAEELWRAGALWNTFLFAADGPELWRLAAAQMPTVARGLDDVFELPCDARTTALAGLYRALPTLDFARTVLQARPERFGVLPIRPCGWTDLGTPRRVAACVEDPGGARPLSPTRAWAAAEVVLGPRARAAVSPLPSASIGEVGA